MLAAELGSDVTFALHGGTALGTGRGEQIVPVLSRHTQHWVIALHRGGLSTPERLRRARPAARRTTPRRDRPVEPVLEALAGGDPRQLALSLGNDLQAAAVSMAPDLRRTLRAGVTAGALAGLVSGSGPTCAFLCAGADAAIDVATELAGVGVCRTVRVAHGPVPGARVVDQHEPPVRPRPGPRCVPDASTRSSPEIAQNLVNLESVTAHVPGDASRVLLDAVSLGVERGRADRRRRTQRRRQDHPARHPHRRACRPTRAG